MAKQVADQYSNKAYGEVIESAANTLTFNEISTNVSVFDKVAWIINRIEWFLDVVAYGLFTAGADQIQMALTASNNINDLELSNPAVIDMATVYNHVQGTPATAILRDGPIIRDFGSMPGGGIIVAPRPLYVAVEGNSLGNPATVKMRFSFQQLKMTPADYLELIDFYRIVS